jgi:hypothetical protein
LSAPLEKKIWKGVFPKKDLTIVPKNEISNHKKANITLKRTETRSELVSED